MFSLRTAEVPDDDLCYIVPGRPETISECGFNPETQTFVVIHGWTVGRHPPLSFNPTQPPLWGRCPGGSEPREEARARKHPP